MLPPLVDAMRIRLMTPNCLYESDDSSARRELVSELLMSVQSVDTLDSACQVAVLKFERSGKVSQQFSTTSIANCDQPEPSKIPQAKPGICFSTIAEKAVAAYWDNGLM